MNAREALLQQARIRYLEFPWHAEQRRMIEYLDRRLSAPPADDWDARQQDMLEDRLKDIIRPRRSGAAI